MCECVSWNWLPSAFESRLCSSLSDSMLNDIKLVVSKWPRWECLQKLAHCTNQNIWKGKRNGTESCSIFEFTYSFLCCVHLIIKFFQWLFFTIILIFISMTSICFLLYYFYFSAEMSYFSAEIFIHWKYVLFYFIDYCYNSCSNIFLSPFHYLVHLQIRQKSLSFILRMCSIPSLLHMGR